MFLHSRRLLQHQKTFDLKNPTLPPEFTHSGASRVVVQSDGSLANEGVGVTAPDHRWDGTAWVSIGRVIWPVAVTNLFTNNCDLGEADWTVEQATVNDADTVTLLGSNVLEKLEETAVSATHAIRQDQANTGGEDVAIAGFAKADERSKFSLEVSNGSDKMTTVFDLSAETAVDSTAGAATHYGSHLERRANGIYRWELAGIPNVSGSSYRMRLKMMDGADTSYLGTLGEGMYLGGFMAAASRTLPELIVTEASEVEQAARTYSVTELNALGTQPISGVVRLGMRLAEMDADGTQNFFDLSDGTASNRVRFFADSSGDVRCIIKNGGSTVFDEQILIATHGIADRERFTVAAQLATNAVRLQVNTHQSSLDTSVAIPAGFSQIDFGRDYTGSLEAPMHLDEFVWEPWATLS